MNTTTRWGRAALAAGSLGGLLAAAGCGVTREATRIPAGVTSAANQTGLPIVVSCEPTQRTIVRPTMVNGAAMSQVECVAGEGQAPAAAQFDGRPIAPMPLVARTAVAQPAYREVADTELVPVSTRASAAPVRARQIVYDERRAPRRSVKKSAVIIGTSAGAGAGLGAAIGGKKGAVVGALLGGGGATLWDQITRRRE